MPNLDHPVRTYVLFREKPDGSRTKVGMYPSLDECHHAIVRSEMRRTAFLDDVARDEDHPPRYAIHNILQQHVLACGTPDELLPPRMLPAPSNDDDAAEAEVIDIEGSMH